MSSSTLIPAAVCMSLALHGGALAVIDRLPRGWQLSESGPARLGAGVLQARLRAEPVVEKQDALTALPEKVVPRAAATPAPIAAARPVVRPAFGPVAPPAYLPASELDEKPQIRTHVEPEFPADAPVARGRVVLRLYIGATGNVDDIAVVSAEPREVFESSARRAFTAALFTPGRKNGEAVRSTLTLELLFGAPAPVTQAKLPEGPQWQPPRRAATPPLRKETP